MQIDNVADLIEQVEYLSLGGVHAHSPHGVAQLPGADAAALVPGKIRYTKGISELPLYRYRWFSLLKSAVLENVVQRSLYYPWENAKLVWVCLDFYIW